MANHVYFNVEVEGLTEEQFNCLWKTEEVKYKNYNDEDCTRHDLIDLHNQPFMLKIERTEDEDGWIENSYNWYCNNIGAKWCHIEEWECYPTFSGYSAWSQPLYLVENLLEYASNRFGVEVSAKMTYEDEFRNFIGVDYFETFEEDGEWFATSSENTINGDELTERVQKYFDMEDDDFDWDDHSEELNRTASEYMDDLVYGFFERGVLNDD